ncbi:MAG: L-lactate dehydrogenase [Clostridiales bacterium]|jgi:L-lactate dehydrogenase|nr:L-lactate dehydrogenase [Clostridiales bacterium]
MKNKVTIIGAGTVGASIAYTLAARDLASDILLIDINEAKAKGEAMDIFQATPYLSPAVVRAGSYEDAEGSDIVIITSGMPRKPGMTRIDLVQANVKIIKSIAPQIAKHAPDAKYILVANPVDILTYVFIKETGLPAERVIGSGTLLDTARLRTRIAEFFKVNQNQVDANVFGEHGDTSFVPWSMATVAGIPLEQYTKSLKEIPEGVKEFNEDEVVEYVRKSGGQIIANKGVTNYGIAASVCQLVKCLSSDIDSIFTVSVLMQGEYGIEDVCVSIMAIVNCNGVKTTIEAPITEEERLKLVASADALKKVIAEALN